MTSLKQIPLFQGLSEEALSEIQSCLREASFGKGEALFREGTPCERIFIVREGRVKLCRVSSEGKEQILQRLGPGDTCACHPGSSDWACLATAEALTPCTVWLLSRNDFARMLGKHPQLAQALNRLLAERLRCFGALATEISLKSVKARLVKFLLAMLASNKEKGNVLFIPFTRQEMAQSIGASRETVTRHLHNLKRQKLIDIKPYQIIIRDKEGLENLL
jgi:CRP/FNR family transcriptional regulator